MPLNYSTSFVFQITGPLEDTNLRRGFVATVSETGSVSLFILATVAIGPSLACFPTLLLQPLMDFAARNQRSPILNMTLYWILCFNDFPLFRALTPQQVIKVPSKLVLVYFQATFLPTLNFVQFATRAGLHFDYSIRSLPPGVPSVFPSLHTLALSIL